MDSILLDIEEVLFNWLFSHIPIIATCVVLAVLLIWFTRRMTSLIHSYAARFSKVEADVGQLKTDMLKVKKMNNKFKRKFDIIDAKFESVDKRFDSMDKRFDNLERKFDTLLSQLAFNSKNPD
ncbi:MAG: hypothetical protein WDO14_01000 [Bacteroidota bacterium]